VFLSAFSITDEGQFHASANSLFEFLMQDAGTGTSIEYERPLPPFWNCLDVPTAVARAKQLAFVGNYSSNSNTSNSSKSGNSSSSSNRSNRSKHSNYRSEHVTSNRVSKKQHAEMRAVLQRHKVLGPLVAHAGELLYKY
jgi:hypothetical protein